MATMAKSKKRARTDEAGGGSGTASKRRRNKAASRDAAASAFDDSELDLELGVNRAFERMDGQLLADHIARKTSRFGNDLSPVELSDLYISANAIKDTTSWQKPRTLENLPEFLEKFTDQPEKLSDAPKKNGSPHTIIVSGAGLRSADVVRAVRKFQKKGNTIAKLFAKHIKMEEAISFLQRSRTGMAAGTPARLTDLLENGALSIDSLKRIVVDASYIDQKKRGVMDMKDTMMPLARWLSRTEFKDKYTAGEKRIDLIIY